MIQNPFLTLPMCFFIVKVYGQRFYLFLCGQRDPGFQHELSCLSLEPSWIFKHHTSRGGFTNLFLRKFHVEPENDVLKESRKLLFQGVHFKFVHFLCAVPASKFLNTFPGSLLICHGENPRKFLPPKWDVLLLYPPATQKRKRFENLFFLISCRKLDEQKTFSTKKP